MPVRGDFSKLADLRRRLTRLSVEFRPAVNRSCAEEAVKLIDDGFRRSEDPYGNPWTPLKSRVGKPLLDTGTHLRNTLTPKLTATGFTVSTSFIGARVHQYGAVIRAKNPRLRFGASDAVTSSRPMLVFRAGGTRPRGSSRGRTGGWVSKEQVTIPRRQYMPEGPDYGARWTKGMRRAANTTINQLLGRAG